MQPGEVFRNRIRKYNKKKDAFEKKSRRLSWSRLIVFLAGLAAIYISTLFNFVVLISIIIVFIAVFLRIVYLHNKALTQMQKAERLENINQVEVNALNHDFSSFAHGGGYQAPEHDFSFDLNIFGQNSVFQLFNRTITDNGEQKLADWFSRPLLKADDIKNRQEAVRDLSQHLNHLQWFMETGQKRRFTKEQTHNLNVWTGRKGHSVKKERWLARSFSLVSLILSGLTIAGVIFWPWLILWVIAGLTITATYNRKVNEHHAGLNHIAPSLETLNQLISIITDLEFKSETLKTEQNKLNSSMDDSSLKKLVNILQAFDVRHNVFAAFLLNSLFLWDLHQIARLSSWKQKHGAELKEKTESIFTFDALISLANFAYCYPEYTYPEPEDSSTDTFHLEGTNCKHILIPKQERVGNPISMTEKGSFSIITGANMAGKSTYLRTIGLNIILAQLGVPVDCETFTFTPVRVISSLSTKDSLVKNESFFYAELKRLQYIIQTLEKGEQLFCLLDEILKGTNSKDKQTGSQKLLRKLIKYESNGIVATHDLQLGELEKEFPRKIQNHCFEVEIKNDKLYFDYQLKAGIAQSLNASFLMRKMGITE